MSTSIKYLDNYEKYIVEFWPLTNIKSTRVHSLLLSVFSEICIRGPETIIYTWTTEDL